ncbi:hypothetical protein [Sphingobacterium sp. T2]|uniref:hypothetical protein n=1 Tax=Sphingobacterium sp. T2 TaxID=1590596 RepID=UPI000A909A27|nr:hypothetical protein [Sphingobacterium sp. T2]
MLNKGWGINQQTSYLLNKGYEVAARYTILKPHEQITRFEAQTEVLELGLTKYLKAHRLKFQLNGSYTVKNGIYSNRHNKNAWGAIFQVELGI